MTPIRLGAVPLGAATGFGVARVASYAGDALRKPAEKIEGQPGKGPACAANVRTGQT